MISYWIDSTKGEGNYKELDQNISCDACVIGAGIFGLTTAYYLSLAGLNVVVLDKSAIGTKASGYTTAKITSQHGLIYDYLKNSLSHDMAKQYLETNEEAIENIKNIIDSENIECDFSAQSHFVYTTKGEEINKIEKEVKAVNSLGFDAKFVNKSDLPFDILGAIEIPNQAQFHPRKYMLGLCDCILKRDGYIFTNTTACDVKKDGDFYITYTTNNHTIKSKYVVLASHYPFINIPGFYFTKMYQETSYVIAVNTKTDLFEGMYISSDSPKYSYRTASSGDKKILLLGGVGHKTGQKDISFSSTYDILEKKAKKLYPHCEILYRWNTRDCITLDKIPYIGDFSSLMPNVYIGTGFNKWGMTTSNIAANIISNKILGKENQHEAVFTSTRLKPIKNRIEIKNMVKQVTTSLVLDKIKIPDKIMKNIQNDSGSIVEIDGTKVGIYKDSSGNIFPIKPTCTHLGCELSWNNLDKTWDCPCHGSRFDYMGKALYDPAFKDLEIFNY